MGVLRIRSRPNRSNSPRVSPKMASSTSSPNTITFGSRSISSNKASLIAWVYRLRAIVKLPRASRSRPLASEHEIEHELLVGGLATFRERHRVTDGTCHSCGDFLQLRRGRDTRLDELPPPTRDGIAGDPRIDFLLIAVSPTGQQLLLELHVSLDAVSLGLDEAWTLA